MGVAADRRAPELQGVRRWRLWADAAAAVGVVIAILLLARAALAFTFPAMVRLAAITLACLVALALSVPDGFRRGHAVLGQRWLWLAMAAAAIVGLGAPALKVASGDVPGGFVAFEIDSRIHAGIKVGQYVVVALALALAAASLAPQLRWRALTVTAAAAAFVATLVLTDRTPYEAWVLPRLDPVAAVVVGGGVALALAAILVPLVERGAGR